VSSPVISRSIQMSRLCFASFMASKVTIARMFNEPFPSRRL
jgi:hypothetical protein